MNSVGRQRDVAPFSRPARWLASSIRRAGPLVLVLVLLGGVTAAQAQTLAKGDLRLVGGTKPSEGRVEIYYEGDWGTVCDDYWGTRDADVACRQLGYDGALSAPMQAHFGPGEGPIWLDDLSCRGSEDHLLDCSRVESSAIGHHNCNHYEDAGVTCVATRTPRLAIRFRTIYVTEGDRDPAAYTVVLRTKPSGPVTVGISIPTGSELKTSRSKLTFTPENWNRAQSVWVRAGSDEDMLDDTVVLTHSAGGGGYDTAANVEVRVEVRDNDILPLTATFRNLPDRHNGWMPFTFRLELSQEIEVGFQSMRDNALRVSGGSVKSVKRIDKSSNRYWQVSVEPETWGEVTIALLAIRNCTEAGALCTANGDPLTEGIEQSVPGPPPTTEPRYRPGDLRLVDGNVPWQGRVEIFYASQDIEGGWGTVCDDYWDIQDAHVACRQLGYSRALEAHREAHFGAGSGPIWLGGLVCGSSDASLLDCWRSLEIGAPNCRHSEDAGVTCDTTGVDRISVTPGVLQVVEEDPAGAAYQVALLARPSGPVTIYVEGTAGHGRDGRSFERDFHDRELEPAAERNGDGGGRCGRGYGRRLALPPRDRRLRRNDGRGRRGYGTG